MPVVVTRSLLQKFSARVDLHLFVIGRMIWSYMKAERLSHLGAVADAALLRADP